ncbi:MAG: response regulator [Lachnospiraceae bacterium]|nr:response regulator [Lachnospiraceae bacterium]
MLPFKTNITVFIVEFLCSVLLQAIYTVSEYGVERAFVVALGLIPVLIVFLLSYKINNQKVVVYCLGVSGISSLYYMSYASHTQGMLVFTFLASATTLTLFLMKEALIGYFSLTIVILVLMGILQKEVIEVFFDTSQYVAFITMYAFSGVALVFTCYSVAKYKKEMDEQNEVAREALEAKSNFLANMSHEIRTPMNAIYGMAELLEERNFKPEEKEYVAVIKRSSENLLSIINEILDFSKVDSGRMEIVEEPYDFNEMLQDVITIIEFRMRDKNLRLQLEIDSHVPTKLIGDETRIRQILINLLTNAVKFTNQGTVTLGINWRDESAMYNMERGRMTIAVQDTGIGISEENISKLFTAFGQIDTRKNRNVEGTGLGLAICKSLTDAMNGSIHVTSKLGFGSTFSVVLPQKIYDVTPSNFSVKHQAAAQVRSSFRPDFIAPKARVLIVDDNKVNRQVAQELMRIFGINAAQAESGREVIDKVSQQLVRYDLIFMDHMMPFMDGMEATRLIRQMNNEYAARVPIVALTANAIKGVEEQFLAVGMNDYLPKPIRVEQLAVMLKKWLPREKLFPAGTPIEEVERREAALSMQNLTPEQMLDRLDGIDTNTGVRNCAGNVKAYIELLRTYASSNLPNLLQDFYEKEDMQNYAVIAHSIKGGSLSVGALDVAEKAYALERAGKREDLNYIWDHHEEMLEEYNEILEMLKRYFLPGRRI